MTTVPGTYFTKEQLEADLKADKVTAGIRTGSDKLSCYGFVYATEWKQYDKALAWYILAAMKNNSYAQNNIGVLYKNGLGVPKNYLCALKWYLKAAEQNEYENTPNNIGLLFENGYGVPLDKYKALEWCCHGGNKTYKDGLKELGYHRSATDKKKTREQLIKETEAILDTEKKKLEEKQKKSQQEMKALVDLNITYKLTGGGQNAWKDVPILFIDDKKRYTNPINSSVTCSMDERLELMQQFRSLKQDKNTFESQAKQLESLKQEKINFELQIKERDKELVSLRNDKQSLQRGNSTVQHQIKDSKINSLQSENQELKHKIEECEQQINAKDNKINLLENKHHTFSVQQTQTLTALEKDKKNTANEMERLKASYTTLEQLLKSKEDVIVSLNRENQTLSTAHQGNQQGASDMVETLKNLLQGKNNEIDLLKQNMEHALDKEKGKIKKLLKEIKQLKQNQHQQIVSSQEASCSSSTTVPVAAAVNTGTNEDDPNNDFNYDTECGTEYSSSDNASSEDGDHANDLNYDSDA